jgi:ubiquinone/menaquinone biosynthesis C-methylase UbiE
MEPLHPISSADSQPEWADPDVAAAWRYWQAKHAEETRPLTDLLMEAAQIRPGMDVLDLASGAGETAFALAKAVGQGGQVIATDLTSAMLAIIADGAKAQGLTNLRCQQADATALPFPDQPFDVVTCRMGIMHIPNATQALCEARRVLREGGQAAFLVWGPPEGQGMFLHHQILARHVPMPAPMPHAPHPLRFAQPGTLAAALREAGFQQVIEETHRCMLSWVGTPEEVWQHTREVAAPLRQLLARLPIALVAQVNEEIHAALRRYSDGQRVNRPTVVHVGNGKDSRQTGHIEFYQGRRHGLRQRAEVA